MDVSGSIVRGTVLAGMGIGGWMLEETFGYVGGWIASLIGAGVPVEIAWMLGCSAGIVLGDLLTALLGGDVTSGRVAGILKGIVASVGGVIGLLFGDGYLGFVLGIWVPTVLLDIAGY